MLGIFNTSQSFIMNNSMHDGTFLSPQNFYPGLDLSLRGSKCYCCCGSDENASNQSILIFQRLNFSLLHERGKFSKRILPKIFISFIQHTRHDSRILMLRLSCGETNGCIHAHDSNANRNIMLTLVCANCPSSI